ncbi:MAG TPA: glycosyltransferase family 2 protein [Acidimicrobiales bacterium]|nr:glycosyltransferase family 2 protein [Acidimicrobiales bacterium]
MLNHKRIAVVLPAYNAAITLKKTLGEIDRTVVDDVLIVDDASTDGTAAVARELGLEPIVHLNNRGYGGNQKTCYAAALDKGADVVVMLHPDYQYSPRLVVPLAGMIAYGEYDMALGSRILTQNAIKGGMPVYKYVANRALTVFENVMVGGKLSEYHTGLRAFSKELIGTVNLDLNSDDFVFDNQMIVQALAAGARIGELSCPTRYGADASSINFKRSVKYGFGVLKTSVQYRAHKSGVKEFPYLHVDRPLRRDDERRSDVADDADDADASVSSPDATNGSDAAPTQRAHTGRGRTPSSIDA